MLKYSIIWKKALSLLIKCAKISTNMNHTSYWYSGVQTYAEFQYIPHYVVKLKTEIFVSLYDDGNKHHKRQINL
jgi:hypothetical protein